MPAQHIWERVLCIGMLEKRLQPRKDRPSEPKITRTTIREAWCHHQGVLRDIFDSPLGAIVDGEEGILGEVGIVGARWCVIGHAGDFVQTIGFV